MEKLIITVATTGDFATKEHTPYLPTTPEEIAESIYESWKAGAAIAHIHVRDNEGKPTLDSDKYIEVVKRLKEMNCDIIINFTTAGGELRDVTKRFPIVELHPEVASYDAGSFNIGPNVFIHSAEMLEQLAEKMQENNVKPEIEVFDVGMIHNALRVAKKGLIKPPFFFQFVLGSQGGIPATPENLMFMKNAIPEGSIWSAIGASKDQLMINMMSIVLGGHVRVGMEDAVYYRKGELATTNAQFVKRIVELANIYGREVATPDEAREIIGLKVKNKVLAN
ncbi:3-keto-5-aminohexanoate cleavage protein [Bacillus sp. 7884-1]|uniref:3-keto-5-aminohexanoate cleavage protein n=1 Tax=Bacillus sp. 7884-1 TaxID=2021693 RepID=UPI000BA5E281|nr:3-keto-5-aminohexanoate cleavage protein [Bacillus sp. 7884-1]PAE31304.1 3-keto-5-aminohexanoate cleavage protein [Bacillus sp. 7884-1]